MVEERGLARPVVAGIVATICFLAAAVLFSTMAACFVNKQRRRKLKRKRGEGEVLVINMSSHVLSTPGISWCLNIGWGFTCTQLIHVLELQPLSDSYPQIFNCMFKQETSIKLSDLEYKLKVA